MKIMKTGTYGYSGEGERNDGLLSLAIAALQELMREDPRQGSMLAKRMKFSI
jgi:hypothetical protein